MSFIEKLQKRRSIYALGRNTQQSVSEIEELIKEAVRQSPSSFNSQSSRAVIVFDDENMKLWDMAANALQTAIGASDDDFAETKAKMSSFGAGKGTVLFFEDQDVVKGLQESFPLYAENFPIWSEQSTGIASANTWSVLADNNIGANLQHYNPVIDDSVANAYDVPSNWKLRGQLVFGSIEAPAGDKEFMPDSDRFKTIK